MQNVKKDKVNSINDILEEIVRCVTAPSFCVMPWKCVTMAVGDRTDPLVKKSVVHIYRTSKDGQNIFQIKVHNCKKDICDHTICTKECENTRQTNRQAGNEAFQYEINKRKRKKKNKCSDGNKETTVGCCQVNKLPTDKSENSSFIKGSKQDSVSSQRNKRTSKKFENKEKPSCTLQLYAEGKSRKLNFQLHPAMKVFLGKALDRIEGHDSKVHRKTSLPSYIMPENFEELRKTNGDSKSEMARTTKKSSIDSCSNKNKDTESIEEFEINLPDNTNNAKVYENDLSERYYHYNGNDPPEKVEGPGICSELKINAGFLFNSNIPAQQVTNGKGNSEKKNLPPRNEWYLGRTSEKFHDEQLNTHQRTTIQPISELHHEGKMKYNQNERLMEDKRFYSTNVRHPTIQYHKTGSCISQYGNIGEKSNEIRNPNHSSRNISCEYENRPQFYSNPLECFQNRARDNITAGYHNDNNELLVNDIRNINNQNYSIYHNRAPMNSTDNLNSQLIYRSNTGINQPPIIQESFSMSPEHDTFLANDGVYTNRFHESRQYNKISNHGSDRINLRGASTQRYKIPYDQHSINFSKENINRETQILHEEREHRKESRQFKRNHVSNTIDNNTRTYLEPENRIEFREMNKHDPLKHFSNESTSDRSCSNIKDRMRNVRNCQQSFVNDQRYINRQDIGIRSEIKMNHGSNKPIRGKYWKEEEKSNSNNDRRRPGNSSTAQYYNLPTCSTLESKRLANKQNNANIGKNYSDSTDRKENKRFTRGGKNGKNRRDKRNTDNAFFHQNTNQMLPNEDTTSHPHYKIINKPRIQCENEEEEVNNRFKRSNRKFKTESSNISKTNAVYHRKIPKESDQNIERCQAMDTTNNSNCSLDNYTNDASEKSSDILSFRYQFPEDCSNYHLIKPRQKNEIREQHSREKINETNEGSYNDEYDTDSKFLCYPSQISWDHFTEPNQIIPNLNQKHYLVDHNTRNEKIVEPKNSIALESESSRLCLACCKALNEGKPAFLEDYCMENYEKRNSCGKNLIMNNSQYKDKRSVEEPYCIKNDLVPNKDMLSYNSTNLNLKEVGNPIECSFTSTSVKNNQFGHNDNIQNIDVPCDIIDSHFHKEQNATMQCENLQKKQSKMIHSQSVKKIFSHAKEYLTLTKRSTSSIKCGLKNGIVQSLNTTSQLAGTLITVESQPSPDRKYSEDAPGDKKDTDSCNVNKMEYCNTEARARCKTENNVDVPHTTDIQGRMCNSDIPLEEFRKNSTSLCTYTDTKLFKSSRNTPYQTNLKDEKYRLYGSNETPMDPPSTEVNNANFIRNEYNILQSESECEGFSDDICCYSSSEWQSEVAKNWVASTRKKYIKHDYRCKGNSKKYVSVESLRSDLSKYKVVKDDTFKRKLYDNKPMINATIALSPDKHKGKNDNLEVEISQDQFQVNYYSKQKSDHRISNLVPNSIKNNYKKIKGFVKRKHTQKKYKSLTRFPVLKSPSFTETQSPSVLTPVTSTSIATKSEDTTVVTENTTVEGFTNESKTEIFTSDSNFIESDPIIRKIEPSIWQKFVSKRFSMQSKEISENMETENSSASDVSLEQSSLQVRSNQSTTKTFESTHDSFVLKRTQKYPNNNVCESAPLEQRRGSKTYQTNRLTRSESMDDQYKETEESVLNLSSTCFENPMVDPKTGFRPLLPIQY